MEEIRSYLDENADEELRQTADRVGEGLANLQLRHRIQLASRDRRMIERRRRWLFRILLAVFVVFIVLGYYWYTRPVTDLPQSTPEQQKSGAAEQQVTPQPMPSQQPMAAAQEKTPQSFPAQRRITPQVRGSHDSAISGQADRIVALCQYPPAFPWSPAGSLALPDKDMRAGDFSGAYIRLQRTERLMPDNDTLLLMKACCLLHLKEGPEALRYLGKIGANQKNWKSEIDWYRALALLRSGDTSGAKQIFTTIQKQQQHPYRQQSSQALEWLR